MKRQYIMAVSIMALIMAAAGCGNGQEAENKSTMLSFEDNTDKDIEEQSQNNETEHNTSEGSISNNERDNDDTLDVYSQSSSQDIIIIGGKVRSITQDSFIISRVLMEDSSDGKGSLVVMPEAGSPEEELVTVRCTDLTTFEHWTIQGGGAGIVTKEAAFSDIQEGGGLEASGYFDGEEFVAEKVIIEIYE